MSSKYKQIIPAEIEWQGDLPCSASFGDIYFSRENGLAESRYVFIDSLRLVERWQALKSGEIFTIAETGFGTGLNFLLCYHLWQQYAPEGAKLHFISCEKFPLKKSDLIRALSLWPELIESAEKLIKYYPSLTPGFHWLDFADDKVCLTLIFDDVLEAYNKLSLSGDLVLEQRLRQQQVDAWFLDGFAPAKNEAMWQDKLYYLMASLSKSGTTIASFTAAGGVRKGLEAAGFSVEKHKGFGRKRHMITAEFKSASAKTPRSIRKTPWFQAEYKPYQEKSALVVGAGLAGCFMARRLAEQGWSVKIIDKYPQAGMQASGNPGAVLFPKLSAYHSPLSELMLSAYLYSSVFIKEHYAAIRQSGCLILADDDKEKKIQKEIERWLEYCPELAIPVDSQQASERAGVNLNFGGLFFPASFYLDSQKFCQFLLNHSEIQFFPDTVIENLNYIDEQWNAGQHNASIAVIANGWEASQFKACENLPLRPLSGQMTALKPQAPLDGLKTVVCGNGHILPVDEKSQWTGTSYHPNIADNRLKSSDDDENISKLPLMINGLSSENLIIKRSWAGIRCSTTDYVPVVGELCHEGAFNNQYQLFRKNANAWVENPAPSQKGLYIFTGFGSKGLTTIPLLSLHLSQLIEGRMSPLPANLIQAVSPARFLYRKLCRNEGG